MSYPRTLAILVTTVLLVMASSARAASIWLNPVTQTAVIGEQASFELHMDFSSDPTLGGGIDIFYDSTMLQFVSFVFDASLGDDLAVRRDPDVLTGTLNGLAFGKDTGLSGPSIVGVLTFDTLALGTTSLSLADNISPAGGFYSAVTFDPQSVDYQGAEVTIAPVPVPAAVWLLLSGMTLIGTLVRRQRNC
jgi:hypothetical protein